MKKKSTGTQNVDTYERMLNCFAYNNAKIHATYFEVKHMQTFMS